MTHAFPTRRSSDLPRSAPRRGSTTGRRTSTRTGTRAARSPAPRPGSSRRAFPALLAALVLGVAHQPDLLHAGALQQHHRVHHLLVVGAAVAGHEDRLLRVLVDDRPHSRFAFLRSHRLPPRSEERCVVQEVVDTGWSRWARADSRNNRRNNNK